MCTIGCHIKYDVWWIKYIWKCTGGSHTTHDDKWYLVKCTVHIWLMINDLMIMIKYIWKCTGGSHTTHDDKWFLVKCTDHIWLMINDLMIMINGHIMIKVH